jgi:hypothetical protein
MFKFIYSKIKEELAYLSDIKTKIIVEIQIDSTGKVINPVIRKGIDEKIDKKIIEIMKQMPDWKPAYLYGKPIKQNYLIPIEAENK